MMRICKTSVLASLALLLITGPVTAQVFIGPESVGLAQTYATQSRGSGAIGWNVANLGYTDNPRFSMRFGLFPLVPFPNLNMMNSSVSLAWFNKYFTQGSVLSDADKADLLSIFPQDGWSLTPEMNAKILGMSFGRTAVALELDVQGNVVLPTSLLRFGFYGNNFNEPISLSDLNTEAQVVGALSIAHAFPVQIPFLSDIAEETYLGAGVKALIGGGYAGTENVTGSITTYPEKAVVDGRATARYALGGYGYAFDTGLSAKITPKLQAGISFNNLFGSIRWLDTYKNASYEYQFHLDTDTLDFLAEDFNENDMLDNAVKVDTSYDGASFTTQYPAYMIVGTQYDLTGGVSLYLNYKQGFSNHFDVTTNPRFSLATELRPAGWIAFRTGVAAGGRTGMLYAAGLGLGGRHYKLNLGVASVRGILNNSRGISVSLGQELAW